MSICEVCTNDKSEKYYTYEVKDKNTGEVTQQLNICDDCAKKIYGYEIPFTHPHIRLICQCQILDFMSLLDKHNEWQKIQNLGNEEPVKGESNQNPVYNSNNPWTSTCTRYCTNAKNIDTGEIKSKRSKWWKIK